VSGPGSDRGAEAAPPSAGPTRATAGTATATAHPNIALAKYWGKVPGSANAPSVPSLSVTLSGMLTTTTVSFAPELGADELELNGSPADARALARAAELLGRVRALAGLTEYARVTTRNDFPTAAGLASSASGFAALAVAARAAAGLPLDLAAASDLARRSSASSARSLFGGFVELPAGSAPLGSSGPHGGQAPSGSAETWPPQAPLPAVPVVPPGHLDLRVLVAVTTERTKAVLSTDGMNHTARSSPFYAAWVDHAPSLFARIKRAVLARDLPALGEAAEESALAMHATAIAAAPGVVYWNGATVEVLAAVRLARAAGVAAWATIDAGPHVKVLTTPGDAARVRETLLQVPGVLRVLEARPGPGAALVVPAAGQGAP
jgi:diphosphomevalonate decarboxylase